MKVKYNRSGFNATLKFNFSQIFQYFVLCINLFRVTIYHRLQNRKNGISDYVEKYFEYK